MSLEITGKIHLIEEEQQISASFKKRTFILFVENERNADWSDYIPFELMQDRTDLLAPYNIGDTIKVSFNLRGREWVKDDVSKFFGSNEAWRIELVQAGTTSVQSGENDVPPSGETDNLPF